MDVNELRNRNITTTCPQCHDTVVLNPHFNPLVGGEDGAHWYFLGTCANSVRLKCNPIFAVYSHNKNEIVERYPIPSFDANTVDASIPEQIRHDYAEAQRCMYVNAYKGAVALFRRVVEAIACDKLRQVAKTPSGNTKRLKELIRFLYTHNHITKDMKDTAGEIKLLGDYGVHVQDDGLDSVKYEEADGVRELTAQLLSAIYIAPSKTKSAQIKRTAKEATKTTPSPKP